ncbi:ABC transporter permease [Aminobacter sp. P9b]|uniref:NitT/TauT family transport system permease protein n=1 Tax=Aminobacter ciceronei TaxID=150723 RepID=A0ABR6CAI7_9HYPH|nr:MULTISPECIES: ABC transporter permease [Aminobacter]WMC97363.1 ABC transporter permease [Aminobacter aminovorans]MBA8908264.1 NitT/TauT family transport system permease protein [Aminobacter ciceronei]MBA9022036.1 NitT/TauT family transport system permease protein [Aminobacter ciceronei]MRX34582.1 ABC transporter permease subunit [Aminobacter sp. MDW-2]QNH34818.1 ABC transporter permease [Aminobacter sp. MDW-2]
MTRLWDSKLFSLAHWSRRLRSPVLWQGLAGIVTFFAVWQIARWLGWMAIIPSPIELAEGIPEEIAQTGYWQNWIDSSRRVFVGFGIAAISAIVIGVLMGMSTRLRAAIFPLFEVMRPVPPLAWLPLAILFWPSSEMTMAFLTFIGAFFPILLNVLAGIDKVDRRYVQAALSLGSSRGALFRRILVPGALPSLFTGLAIAIGITWEVVIAAEMASGTNGLGYMTWDSYMTHSMIGIVLGMLSIGLAGMACSWMMRWVGQIATPWQK